MTTHAILEEARATANADIIDHCQLFASFLGGLQMLMVSEQDLEGRHAKFHKIIEQSPNHTAPLLANESRFPELEVALDNEPQDSINKKPQSPPHIKIKSSSSHQSCLGRFAIGRGSC